MRRLLLVVNPSASGFTGAMLRAVRDELTQSFAVETVWPEGPNASRDAAADAAKEGFEVVAAMGGDGVVHHVANGLVGTGSALGVIPAGTTNVYSRILGIPSRARKAAAALREASPETVPVAAITLDGSPRPTYATFALGVGYDAEVVELAERRPASKTYFGGIHYARSALKTVWSGFRNRPATLRAVAHGRSADGVAVVAQIHGPYTYFGPIPLRVGPSLEDGITVVVARTLSPGAAARLISRVLLSRMVGAGDAELWAGVARLSVSAEPEALVQADGEQLGKATEVAVTTVVEGLRVMTP
jgi:diacylglycerol kinase family enzyme